MITIPTSQSQNADLSCWSSTRPGNARANTSLVSQFGHRSSSIETDTYTTYTHSKLIMRGTAVDQSDRSRSLPSRTSPATLKSP
jgi:hypothetical protein